MLVMMVSVCVLIYFTLCFIYNIWLYIEVCCLAAEAKQPQKTLPKAVFGTIAIVTIFYAFASLALVGMQNYKDIDTESGFSVAFEDNNWQWASKTVAIGELIALPIVVLISFLAQPRLQYAMAVDGLLPAVFKKLDPYGNLKESIFITGVAMTLVALFVPFTYLNDMISAGVLLSFNLTNSSLIIVRKQHATKSRYCLEYVTYYNILCFISAMLFIYVDLSSVWLLFPILSLVGVFFIIYQLAANCVETEDPEKEFQYRVPYMPFTPLIGIYLNYYLVAQLQWYSLLMILGYVFLGIVFYFSYSMKHSIGNTN